MAQKRKSFRWKSVELQYDYMLESCSKRQKQSPPSPAHPALLLPLQQTSAAHVRLLPTDEECRIMAGLAAAFPSLRLQSFVLFSGGAVGADTVFGAAADRAGFQVIHWSFRQHRSQAGRTSQHYSLPLSLLQLVHPHVMAAASALNRTFAQRPFTQHLLCRDFFQVFCADSVYAVSSFSKHAGGRLHVPGGTAWACQMYINRFQPLGRQPAERCRLYFFEQEQGSWHTWQPLLQEWQAIAVPPFPRGRCAGIGCRALNVRGKQAIESLFLYKPQPELESVSSSSSSSCSSSTTASSPDY